MTRRQQLKCALFAALALFALYGTESQNMAYFANGGGPAAFAKFVVDLKVNPAARSIGLDIAVFFYAAAIYMVIEARKLGIRFVWAYVIGGLLIAISVTFPLFLIARERGLARGKSPLSATSDTLPVGDLVGLALLGALTIALSVFVIDV